MDIPTDRGARRLLRFAGIDVGSQVHVIAIVDESSRVLVKPTPFNEDASGYEKLFNLLGSVEDVLVAMEATGHYGRNLRASLGGKGFRVAVLNPLRTRRFAQEDLTRAKTDSIDALGIARFAAQKHPVANPAPEDPVTEDLRETLRLHDRLAQDFGDRVRQLHRLVDLCFPEFPRYVRTLDSRLATSILHDFPTAVAFTQPRARRLASLRYYGRRVVGRARARQLLQAALVSVGRHHSHAYSAQVQYLCEEIDALRARVHQLRSEIDQTIRSLPLGSLLLSIKPLGPHAVAHIIASVGDPSRFRHARAFTAYVGVVPGTCHSGLRRPGHASINPLGNARLRKALWMPVLTAVSKDPWLRAFYQRLRAAGKRPKVALVAAMRKLLTAVYSVAKNKKPFVPYST